MSRDDLFNINAGIVRTLVEAAATYCPEALIGVVTNPVNSTLPIAAEVLKEAGTYQPNRLFGVSTLDVVRANTFVSELKGVNVAEVDVPVVGGHSGTTILPLFSQTTPSLNFTYAPIDCIRTQYYGSYLSCQHSFHQQYVPNKYIDCCVRNVVWCMRRQEEIEGLTNRTQNAGTEVVEAKEGAGSATLSMAYAAARFVESCLRGLSGEKDVVECSYVPTNAVEGMNFFASKVLLGPNGAEEVYGLGELSEYEASLLPGVKEELDGNIQKGIDWAQAELSGANKQQEAASSQ
jgi:malate dehydrogenase